MSFIGKGQTVGDLLEWDGTAWVPVTFSGGGYNTVEEEGVALPSRTVINFTGAGVAAIDSGGKTVVNIPGAAGGVTGFTYAVANRAELVAAAASIAGGVITLHPASYLVVGNITLNAGERIVLPANSKLIGGGSIRQYSIIANVGSAVITMGDDTNLECLNVDNVTNACVSMANASGTSTVKNCFLVSNNNGINILGGGSKFVEYVVFNVTNDGVATSGGTIIQNAIIRFCSYVAAQRMLQVAVGTSIARLRIESQLCQVALGSNALNIEGTVTFIECQNNTLWSAGTVFNRTGTLSGGRIANNTFVAGNEFTCFNGVNVVAPGAGPVASFVVLRNNLWRNTAGSSFKLLNETPMQTNAPPA